MNTLRPAQWLVAFSFSLLAARSGRGDDLQIDGAFPGGNIKIDRIEGDAVFLRRIPQ